MRIRRTPTRLAAIAAAVLVSIVGPGLAPVSAQDSPSGIAAGVPPPYNGDPPAPGTPPPGPGVGTDGSQLKQSVQCATSFQQADLKAYPAGQQWLRLPEAHRFATGKGQTVAVIDTGVNDHQYLKLTDAKADYLGVAGPRDCDGHGTEVAGIIAANTPADIGFQGMAPSAQIMSIRQSSSVIRRTKEGQQETGAGTPTTLAFAIRWAVDHNATVINMSLAACFPATAGTTLTPDQKLLQAAIHYAVERNIVLVAAAGNLQQQGQPCGTQNNNPDPNAPTWIESPAWFADDVLSVAAIATTTTDAQQAGQPAGFTVWGPWVSVAAPGTNITSLDPGSPTGLSDQTYENNHVQGIQGTSFAAPYVAGLAALVKERFPGLDVHQVMNRIKMTAQHPAAPGGRDNQVGYGMIDPVAALTSVVPGEPGTPAAATAQRIPSDLGTLDGRSLSPMVIAMLGTATGVALLLITLFVVHAMNTAKRRQRVPASRLRL